LWGVGRRLKSRNAPVRAQAGNSIGREAQAARSLAALRNPSTIDVVAERARS
jgi:hypothetical protein